MGYQGLVGEMRGTTHNEGTKLAWLCKSVEARAKMPLQESRTDVDIIVLYPSIAAAATLLFAHLLQMTSTLVDQFQSRS